MVIIKKINLRVVQFVLLLFLSYSIKAQDKFVTLNYGANLNFAHPTLISYLPDEMRIIPSLNGNIGIQFWRKKESKTFGVSFGIELLKKGYGIQQTKFNNDSIFGYITVKPNTIAIQFPILLYQSKELLKKTFYYYYGISINYNNFHEINYKGYLTSRINNSTLYFSSVSKQNFRQSITPSIILGGLLLSNNKRFGIGISYHYELLKFTNIQIINTVNNIEYQSYVIPYQSYISFKLYYKFGKKATQ